MSLSNVRVRDSPLRYKRYYDAFVCAIKALIERRRRAGDPCNDYDKSPPLNVLIVGPGARGPLLNQLILAYTAVSMVRSCCEVLCGK